MSGRLIILPKKRWNVWNRENVAKVRYDEQQHQLKQEEEQERQRKVDGEARLEALRGRKRRRDGSAPVRVKTEAEVEAPAASIVTAEGHINFFQDAERAQGGNAEYEREKQELELREMRKQGIAPLRLGGSASEADTQPWFTFVAKGEPVPHRSAQGRLLDDEKASQAQEREKSRKRTADPMGKLVQEQLDEHGSPARQTHQGAGSAVVKYESDASNSSSSELSSSHHSKASSKDRKSKKHKKEKKQKKHHRKKDKKARRKETAQASPQGPTVEELRQKRIKREALERARSSHMLSKHAGSAEEAEFATQHARRNEKKYFSAFFK
mmetsp:Transcript_18212/g.53211  ORF Transcript_18212/g.53211 Transcript_18212/m.53211 type:complete len:325 (-) Transcript_18212:162-1136(-)|eukprot:CAMPEP_0118969106 /NCGR_PEP_ID=MMETSP1173-20130426/6231_1 /TAXON_ID=1034831 /ORGANISM="Rhizochromulina marina cf, Strain CCMP1243" /LENGTH=324 /DNA_ID=CAMNT_0006918305 /DNA_START=118 /DNA_END=1092 /DNA_ORIENTATION=-